MYPADFEKRIEQAKQANFENLNCLGAVFYLLGATDKERYIDPWLQRTTVKISFKRVDEMKRNDRYFPESAQAVGIWENRSRHYSHMGVIWPDPNLIIHRRGFNQPLVETTPRQIIRHYNADEIAKNGTQFYYLQIQDQLPSIWRQVMYNFLDQFANPPLMT